MHARDKYVLRQFRTGVAPFSSSSATWRGILGLAIGAVFTASVHGATITLQATGTVLLDDIAPVPSGIYERSPGQRHPVTITVTYEDTPSYFMGEMHSWDMRTVFWYSGESSFTVDLGILGSYSSALNFLSVESRYNEDLMRDAWGLFSRADDNGNGAYLYFMESSTDLFDDNSLPASPDLEPFLARGQMFGGFFIGGGDEMIYFAIDDAAFVPEASNSLLSFLAAGILLFRRRR